MARRNHAGEDAETAWRAWIPPVALTGMTEESMHVLLWQVRGTTELLMPGGPETLTTGHALWIPAGLSHDLTVQANSVMMPLFFEVAETATTLREPTMIAVDRDLRTLMLAYSSAWNSAIQHSVNLGRQILAMIEEQPPLHSGLHMPQNEAALVIAETLRFNPGDSRSVEALAESVHTSLRTIERSFRAETGSTLRQWRIRNRMEAAAILLRSRATIDAVSRRVGYTNVNAFRRVFRGHFGLSPTAYVQRYGAQ